MKNQKYQCHIWQTPLSNVDLDQYTKIINQLRPAATKDKILSLRQYGYYHVSVENQESQKITGCATFFLSDSFSGGQYAYLADLVVDGDSRGKGYGSAMIAAILDKLQTMLVKNCQLDSGLEKIQAHQLYKKMGFNLTTYNAKAKLFMINTTLSLPKEQEVFFLNAMHMSTNSEPNQLEKITTFIQSCCPESANDNLQEFLTQHGYHNLLYVTGNDHGEIIGAILYEQQNRLSVDGLCYYVSDVFIKTTNKSDQNDIAERLLINLVAKAQQHNGVVNDRQNTIKAVIIELTDQQALAHRLINDKGEITAHAQHGNPESPTNFNQIFSLTSKHFLFSFNENNQTPSNPAPSTTSHLSP